MTTTWEDPLQAVVDLLGYGMDALWAVLYAGQHAALTLALDAHPGDDTLSRVGMDLADALGEVEWTRPELARHGITLNLRPDPDRDPAAGREQLAAVLRVAASVVRALAADAGDETLDTDDLLALGRVAAMLTETQQLIGRTG